MMAVRNAAHLLQRESCRVGFKSDSKVPTVRNASAVRSSTLRKMHCSYKTLKTHSASEENVKVIQGHVSLGTLYNMSENIEQL